MNGTKVIIVAYDVRKFTFVSTWSATPSIRLALHHANEHLLPKPLNEQSSSLSLGVFTVKGVGVELLDYKHPPLPVGDAPTLQSGAGLTCTSLSG